MRYTSCLILLFAIQTIANGQSYGTIHFEEYFDNNSREWFTADKEDIEAKVEGGHYVLNHKDPESSNYYYLKLPDIDFKTKDFTIEAKIKQSAGDDGQGMGLRYCIYKDYSNYRDFFFSTTGYHKLNHYYSEKNHLIKDWTLQKEIVKPKGQYNFLRIERRANLMRFYLNDELIGYDPDNRYFTSRVGFFVSGAAEISVDYLKVWTAPIVINYVDDPLEDVEVENLGANINSSMMEKAPVISPDGEILYYTRTEFHENEDDMNTDIYNSHAGSNETWGKGASMGKPLNNDGNNSVICVMPDGNTLLIMNTYNEDGSSKGGGISLAKRSLEGWQIPQNIELEDYHNNSEYAGYCISPSGKVLISAVERDQTTGGRDLYVSFNLGNNKWSKPVGMGSTLNTIGHEDMPFIAADNKTMYFSSDGRPGLGNSDVWVTRRLDDTWKNWSEPKNLGSGINSPSSEFGFKISALGHYAYLYKTGKVEDGGFGKGDIFRIKLSESAKPEPVVFVKGHVFDSETLEPISADIKYEDLTSHDEMGIAYSEPLHGKYKIALPYGKLYGYLAHKEGYYSISQNLDLTQEDGSHETIIEDLYLTPIKKGVGIRMNNIFFDPDKSDLKEKSFPEINRLVKMMNDNPELRIEIGGHTDITGDIKYNATLSEARAKAVMNYMINQGIDSGRLTATGYGQSNPIKTNNTEEGKAMNRRVEFKIL